jgi:hypothetical protein
MNGTPGSFGGTSVVHAVADVVELHAGTLRGDDLQPIWRGLLLLHVVHADDRIEDQLRAKRSRVEVRFVPWTAGENGEPESLAERFESARVRRSIARDESDPSTPSTPRTVSGSAPLHRRTRPSPPAVAIM